MNLIKCENGHYYDDERNLSCPHCAASVLQDDNLTVPIMSSSANDAVTVALDQTMGGGSPETASLQDAIAKASAGTVNAPVGADEKTVGFFSSTIGKEPVVAWLVCTVGEHFGDDFRLKSGRNFIGRSQSMDVPVTKDATVSRDRHAIVVYEPRGNLFIVQPGDSKELSYLNDEVVLAPREIKMYDRLTVGKTELMFIPCCSSSFNWDMSKDVSKI